MPDINEIIVKSIGEYLLSEVTDLNEYVDGFPEANQDIDYPSISLIVLSSKFEKEKNPREITRGSEVGNEASIKYQIGQWEIQVQLDLWASYKAQRSDIGIKIYEALNKNGEAGNLALQLTDYHNEYANITFTGMNDQNDEAGSHEKEWRRRYDIIVDVAEILEKTEGIMKDLSTQADDIGFNVIVEE